jgi:glucose-1-phosphate cytidylyltransferase
MKVVILAGGYGTRISEETGVRPKPMVEIGGKPILWHIMKIYSAHGIFDFIICCGYKGIVIKEYFANYFLYMSDITFDIKHNQMQVHNNGAEPWQVTLIDTGLSTMTGGRIKRVRDYIGDDRFCLTYGDGVSDIDITSLVQFHVEQKALTTLTAVQPPGRFGTFNLGEQQTKITSFREKPHGDGAWINGGFFVCEPEVINYIDNDTIVWEREPLQRIAHDGLLAAYRHHGFWHPMDTLRDKNTLEEMWSSGNPPWKIW